MIQRKEIVFVGNSIRKGPLQKSITFSENLL